MRKDEGEKLVAELGPTARLFTHDVTNEEEWDRLAEMCLAEGGAHGIVNNAGIYDPRPIAKTDVAFFERNMRINQLGTFLGIRFVERAASAVGRINRQHLLPRRPARHQGHRLYGDEMGGARPDSRPPPWSWRLARSRVNSIHPAFIDTPMLSALSPEHFETLRKTVPLGRAGAAEDVANLILFLLSDGERLHHRL